MDRFSELSDDIIRLIVNSLPAKEAAYVLILSRRFRNLYTIIANLEFDDSVDRFRGTFTRFVTRQMRLLESTTCIRRFSLISKGYLAFYNNKRYIAPNRINEWLRNVLKRGIMYLELNIYGDNGYTLPSMIFICRTLVKLKLGSEIVITVVPRNALLPTLKTLILESVRFDSFYDCAFEALLLACHVLMELKIIGFFWETWKWSGRFSNQSLQRLIIVRYLSEDFDWPDYQSISFHTPSLTYLDYADIVPDAYSIVNFASLVEAKLSLQVVADHLWHGRFPDDNDNLSSNPTNLLNGIRFVKILELSCFQTLEMFSFFRDWIPMFENLHHLTMFHDEDFQTCWRFLPILLKKSPNLKTLVIKEGLHYDNEPDYVCICVLGYTCLLSCPLEVLEISLYDRGTDGEMAQVKHFLGKLSCLKLLIVNVRGVDYEDLSKIAADMHMFPRASAQCKVDMRSP